jgi:hypothetical protein
MAAIPPSVKITKLEAPSECPINTRKPIRVWIHNYSRLFPPRTEFRPILYYYNPKYEQWYPEGYGDVASGIPYCSSAAWEFGAYRTTEETVTYKIEAQCRNTSAGVTNWITTDTRTFTVKYIKEVPPPPRPWWWPPWIPWP